MSLARPATWLVLFTCVALLLARATGAHLHLCFDGQEPPRSLHIGGPAHAVEHHLPNEHAQGHDHAHAHEHAHETQHSDLDLPLFDKLLSKTGKSSVDLPLLLFVLLLFAVLARAAEPLLRRDPRRLELRPPRTLRPPLRGPPLHAF